MLEQNLTNPKTMLQLKREGWTTNQIYAAVKRGELVARNLRKNGKLIWGPGLFYTPLWPDVDRVSPLRDAWSSKC
jgi:hypothetical protein